jgi:uncharacterized protein YbgA (DUF1722 family)/uncharacterized protein YbbK (DUF523 family)
MRSAAFFENYVNISEVVVMQIIEKPILCVSRCLGFESCRYNGGIVKDETISSLKDFANFITVCPECDIGLSTPRESLRLIEKADRSHIFQSKNNSDYTDEMINFSEEFIGKLSEVDGFILKSRSPSCGIKDVKIYSSNEKGASSKKGKGIFAEIVFNRYFGYPIEDEGRLSNYKLRENFFTKIYIFAQFRSVKKRCSIEELLSFHSINKMLFNSFSIKETKEMGRIIANHEHKHIEDLLKEYEVHLKSALQKSARYTSNINILQHCLGYFTKYINSEERQFILESIEKYRSGKLPLSTPLNIIRSYVIRFDIEYLKSQSFFQPYPEELLEVRDSGKGV